MYSLKGQDRDDVISGRLIKLPASIGKREVGREVDIAQIVEMPLEIEAPSIKAPIYDGDHSGKCPCQGYERADVK